MLHCEPELFAVLQDMPIPSPEEHSGEDVLISRLFWPQTTCQSVVHRDDLLVEAAVQSDLSGPELPQLEPM